MCKRNQNGFLLVSRLIHIVLLATFYYGLITVHAMAFDKTVVATTRPDVGNQIRAKQNSLVPNPDYSPADVVRIQLDALGNNKDPHKDAGIEITFRFASPANRQVTGPLSRFVRMLYNPLYSPMLDHQNVSYGEVVKKEDRAMQSVILTAADGQRVGYTFTLSKQQGGPFDQCWMTDSVLRFDVTTI
jgi:hypothetical protein